jgi:hypothetical protein
LESRLLSGERWIYVDQQSLLKIGSSAVERSNLLGEISAWKTRDCSEVL